MNRFGAKIKERLWPFEISYLSQSVNESNGNESPADNLFHNLLIPHAHISDSLLERFFKITSLNEFISYNNSLIDSSLVKLKMDLYASSILKLSDFGFNIGIQLPFHPSSSLQFPFNNSVQEVINNLPLAKKFYPFIDEFSFGFENYIDDGIYHLRVNGDMSKKIIEPRFRGKKYNNFNIIIRDNSKKRPL